MVYEDVDESNRMSVKHFNLLRYVRVGRPPIGVVNVERGLNWSVLIDMHPLLKLSFAQTSILYLHVLDLEVLLGAISLLC